MSFVNIFYTFHLFHKMVQYIYKIFLHHPILYIFRKLCTVIDIQCQDKHTLMFFHQVWHFMSIFYIRADPKLLLKQNQSNINIFINLHWIIDFLHILMADRENLECKSLDNSYKEMDKLIIQIHTYLHCCFEQNQTYKHINLYFECIINFIDKLHTLENHSHENQ